MMKHAVAALQIKKHLEECTCGSCEKAESFYFEEKDGIIRAFGPFDKLEGIPPLWYIPGKHAKYPDSKEHGYCTGQPDEREGGLILAAGFEYTPPSTSLFDAHFADLISVLKH